MKILSFLNFFIFLFCALFFSETVLLANESSKTYCDLLSDRIKSSQIELRLDQEPLTESWGLDSGIILQMQYNNYAKTNSDTEWSYKRDKDNYVEVFSTYYKNSDQNIFDVFGKLKFGDKITSLNKRDVSNLTDKEIDDIFYPPEEIENDLDITLSIEFINEKLEKKSISIKPLILFDNFIYPDIVINNFKNIDSKRSIYEINFIWSYWWEFLDLVPIYEKLNDDLNITKDIENIAYCAYSYQEFEAMDLWHPSIDMKNIVEESNDEVRDDYIIEFYPKEDEKDAKVWITYQWEGNSVLFSDFNFKAFPFDSQILSLDIVNERGDYPLQIEQLYKTFKKINLQKFTGIPDWTIVEKSLQPKHYFSDYFEDIQAMYSIEFRIERNYFYYIYKIIIPILIILIIAWSALWIKPSELESRLTVTIVCLLSLIAYNYIYDKDLPKLDYLTLMDYIILLSYLFAAVPTILSVISYSIHRKTNEDTVSVDEKAKIYGPALFFGSILIISLILIYDNPSTTMFLREFQGISKINL